MGIFVGSPARAQPARKCHRLSHPVPGALPAASPRSRSCLKCNNSVARKREIRVAPPSFLSGSTLRAIAPGATAEARTTGAPRFRSESAHISHRQKGGKVEFQEALDAEALLLGRRSYEYFAAGWSSRPGEWADRLRSLPKYVVSSTSLDGPDWTHATVIKSDAVGGIAKLKQRLGGDIVVYGSRQLVRTLMDHDLVDEVRLTVYPVVLGASERLFDDLADKTPLRLVKATTIGDGFAFLTYEVVRNS